MCVFTHPRSTIYDTRSVKYRDPAKNKRLGSGCNPKMAQLRRHSSFWAVLVLSNKLRYYPFNRGGNRPLPLKLTRFISEPHLV